MPHRSDISPFIYKGERLFSALGYFDRFFLAVVMVRVYLLNKIVKSSYAIQFSGPTYKVLLE
jgi:hypothetical protein